MSGLALEAAGVSCSEIARELLSQPDFFEFHREELPETAATLPKLALARYTGARAGDDEAVNLRVGAMRLLGLSDRAIERECGVDRRTIPYRLVALEKAERIPAVKDRVLMWTANAAEQSGIVLAALMGRATTEVSIDLAAMLKSVATVHGITVEKLQLLTGSATAIVEQRIGAGREEQEAWARANALPVECESVECYHKTPQTLVYPDSSHAEDTFDAAPTRITGGPGGGETSVARL